MRLPERVGRVSYGGCLGGLGCLFLGRMVVEGLIGTYLGLFGGVVAKTFFVCCMGVCCCGLVGLLYAWIVGYPKRMVG